MTPSPLANLEQRPKAVRSGYGDVRYVGFFFLDTILVFLAGYLPLAFVMKPWEKGEDSWAFVISCFVIFQVIGQVLVWLWLCQSFRWHHVRRWWFHLVLHLWFAAAFQAGAGTKVWYWILSVTEKGSDVEAAFGIGVLVSWIIWATIMTLLAKSIGLWISSHEALRVHYSGLGWAKEKRLYFAAGCGKDLVSCLENGLGDGVRNMLLARLESKPFGLGSYSYTVLTLSTPSSGKATDQTPAHLHLKEVFISLGNFWDKRHHRAIGFSRLHHVQLNQAELAELERMLPELFPQV